MVIAKVLSKGEGVYGYSGDQYPFGFDSDSPFATAWLTRKPEFVAEQLSGTQAKDLFLNEVGIKRFLMGNDRWKETGYALTNFGIYQAQPDSSAILLRSRFDQQTVGVGVIYKGYRIFPFAYGQIIPDLMESIVHSASSLLGKNQDGKSITIVAPPDHIYIPRGFIQDGKSQIHRRLVVRSNSLENLTETPLSVSPDGVLYNHTIGQTAEKLGVSLLDRATVRLLNTDDHIMQIQTLLTPPPEYEGNPIGYTAGVEFDAKRIRDGHLPYVGLYVGDELVSMIGTHGLCPGVQIAALGDGFTLPESRGKGYATLLTSILMNILVKEGYSQIVTDIEEGKSWANRLSEVLGLNHEMDIAYQDVVKLEG